MNKYTIITIVALIVIAGAGWSIYTRTTVPSSSNACTPAAMICPDGSAVGRGGPNCEFDACPPVATNPSTTSGQATTTTATTTPVTTILPYRSGVRGAIVVGPTCPVERTPPDPACADKPLEAAVMISRAGTTAPFVVGTTDSNGTFEFALPPGSYTINAGSGKALPRCTPVDVTVAPNSYATTTISCDSGIR